MNVLGCSGTRKSFTIKVSVQHDFRNQNFRNQNFSGEKEKSNPISSLIQFPICLIWPMPIIGKEVLKIKSQFSKSKKTKC